MLYEQYKKDLSEIEALKKENSIMYDAGKGLIKKSYLNVLDIMIKVLENSPYTQRELIKQRELIFEN